MNRRACDLSLKAPKRLTALSSLSPGGNGLGLGTRQSQHSASPEGTLRYRNELKPSKGCVWRAVGTVLEVGYGPIASSAPFLSAHGPGVTDGSALRVSAGKEKKGILPAQPLLAGCDGL